MNILVLRLGLNALHHAFFRHYARQPVKHPVHRIDRSRWQSRNKYLDILREMMAEVRLADQKVSCRIKCREEASRILIASALGELKDRLEGAGLKVGEASCYLDPDLARLRQEFRREHGIDMREALSLYA